MPTYDLSINGKLYEVRAEAAMPLLWVLRDSLGLTGTKFGCGVGLCGSCTVLVEDEPTHSCTAPVSEVAGKVITTIEGLSQDASHPVQIAWLEGHVSQCGYCQPGQILTAVALLRKKPNPSEADIGDAMSKVLCRCGTYQRIRDAVHRVVEAGGVA